MRDKVIQYLIAHYGIDRKRAVKMVDRHPEEIRAAEQYFSLPYYPAGMIATKESAQHLDPCAECEKEAENEAGN